MKPYIKLFCVVCCLLTIFSTRSLVKAEGADHINPAWMPGDDVYRPAASVRGGELRVASPVYIGLMNPNHFPVMDWVSMSYMYEKLIVNDGSFKPTIPWLAASWNYLDNLTVVMTLKKGVMFHDGTAFNAESLKYQMDWIKDKKNMAWSRSWLEPLESIEVVDEYTVKWHFKHPWGSFLGTMASVPGMAISAKALQTDAAIRETKNLQMELLVEREKAEAGDETSLRKVNEMEARIKELAVLAENGKSLDNFPVGSSQYTLESANPGNYIKLKRNPNWWFGKCMGRPEMPYFENIKVSVIPDPSVRLANLKAGALDFINLTAVQYKLVKNDSQLTISTFPANWLVYMAFNHKKGPCRDIRVRKAISHAIDRAALVQGTQFGLGRVASCIYPDNHWAHNPNLEPVAYNPQLAKKLLDEAGYEDGLKLKGFMLNTPEVQAFSKALMAMLAKVGIQWEPTFLGVAGMMTPFQKLDFDLVGSVYPWIQEPDHIATLLYHPDSPFNNGRSHNKEAIALIEAGRREIDEEKRKEIYFKLEAVLYENYEDIWLWWPVAVTASTKRLKGFDAERFTKYGEVFYFSHPLWFADEG